VGLFGACLDTWVRLLACFVVAVSVSGRWTDEDVTAKCVGDCDEHGRVGTMWWLVRRNGDLCTVVPLWVPRAP